VGDGDRNDSGGAKNRIEIPRRPFGIRDVFEGLAEENHIEAILQPDSHRIVKGARVRLETKPGGKNGSRLRAWLAGRDIETRFSSGKRIGAMPRPDIKERPPWRQGKTAGDDAAGIHPRIGIIIQIQFIGPFQR